MQEKVWARRDSYSEKLWFSFPSDLWVQSSWYIMTSVCSCIFLRKNRFWFFFLVIIFIFNLHFPAVDIYAAVAASLAERKKGGQLTDFFRNIKGTIDDDDWDQVCLFKLLDCWSCIFFMKMCNYFYSLYEVFPRRQFCYLMPIRPNYYIYYLYSSSPLNLGVEPGILLKGATLALSFIVQLGREKKEGGGGVD